MSIEISNRLSIKIFTGCHLNSEMRMHLNQSSAWKLTSIQPNKGPDHLMEVHFEGKDYFGCYCASEQIPLQELKKIETHIIDAIRHYCPSLPSENLKLCIFAQVFVS